MASLRRVPWGGLLGKGNGVLREQPGGVAALLHDGAYRVDGDASRIEVDYDTATRAIDVDCRYPIHVFERVADEPGAVGAGSVGEVQIYSAHLTVSFDNRSDRSWSGV